ncbi:MAG: hypothetical protein WC761_01930 [Candidatus Paceibacterota bacterium]
MSVKQYSNGEIVDGTKFTTSHEAISLRIGSMIMPINYAYLVNQLEFANIDMNVGKGWSKESLKIVKATPVLYLGLELKHGRRWVKVLHKEQVFVCYSGEFVPLDAA